MSIRFRFNTYYFIIAIIILFAEIIIALFVHDEIIRPYFGDLLVVILIYSFIKSFINTPTLPTAIAVLLFSYIIELSQYFHIINKLGLQRSQLARVIMGTSFGWADLVMYTAGIAVVLLLEITVSNAMKIK
ncbi:DUF2809 domain-containing protein [Ginsengibacter hankyongi]|uniref:DUF2809 domain-containing protein n=1 Tax=Ginsengibacter hankyongi TaxID=2607284 RepID=A0A5J5IJR9_9BACT|nr:DUF2809 domain-containing protein [Ginsengibacter hankyongi]KAA9038615.1 DUF2809 domain-containing protein [Ginsengibacter hankyongi]